MLLPTAVGAKKQIQTKGKDARIAQIAELGVPQKPARVLTTFSVPGQPGEFAVVCARAAQADAAAFCAVLDANGQVVDDSLGLNVLRVEDKRKGDHLELLFQAQFGKDHVYIAVKAALTPENLDVIGRGFQADLSMLEFMTGVDAFPIGVGLEGGVKVVGEYLVFGKAATTSTQQLLGEFKAAPVPPLEEPAIEEPVDDASTPASPAG